VQTDQQPDIIKYDIHLYHSYLSAFFISAGVPNGEFPETLIAKRSVIVAIKNSYKPLCKQESDNL
jgi:hypothetical protein